MRFPRCLVPGLALFALAVPATALGAGGAGLTSAGAKSHGTKKAKSHSATKVRSAANGGAGINGPASAPTTLAHPTVVGDTAKIVNGVAYAPSYASVQVKQAIWAGNQIRTKPYVFGGGHGKWNDVGYDCSGSVSYVLHAAGLLKTSEASGDLESWGQQGAGQWITVYANGGHAFVEIAGIRLDTSAEQDPNPSSGTGPRWRPVMDTTDGYMARHPSLL